MRHGISIVGLAIAATAVAVAGPIAMAGARSTAQTGSLTFEAALAMISTPGPCPPGSPPGADLCAARTGGGLVRGLGAVSEKYTFFVQEGDCDRVFETTVRLEVAGKGELQLAVDEYRGECISESRNLSRAFTITGGSGTYAGASGGGTVNHQASTGSDTWTGTLTVPGLEFDVTPPTLSGAVDKTVRARKGSKRVRVTYRVTASDAVDGLVQVSCQPRSGSRFKVGRTVVKCSATDTSANATAGRFRVTVKRRR